MTQIAHEVERLAEPMRIDLYLAQAKLGLSRSYIKRLFGEKRITVDGKTVRVSYKVCGGEQVVIDKPEEKRIEFAAEALPVEIVFEDDFLAVVNKPAGLVTHPAPGHESGTLANALLHHFTSLSSGYARGYPGLVHRLDKNTSGLLVVAKNDESHRHLALQLEQRTLRREYKALVWGSFREPSGTIDVSIGRSRTDRRVMTSGAPNPRSAVTHYQVVEEFEFLSLLQVRLETGRTHQVRAHLKESGHPVFGDPEYGGRDSRLRGVEARHRAFAKKLLEIASRQLLHAERIAFRHPHSGETLAFSAELPQDFRQVVELVRHYQ